MRKFTELSLSRLRDMLPVKEALEERKELQAKLQAEHEKIAAQLKKLEQEIVQLESKGQALLLAAEEKAGATVRKLKAKVKSRAVKKTKKVSTKKAVSVPAKTAVKKTAKTKKKKASQPKKAQKKAAAGKQPTVKALAMQVLASKGELSVKEVAQAILQEGYESSSKNFESQVRTILYKEPAFKNVARGKFVLSK